MAIRSTKDIPTSRNIAMVWMVVSLIGALAVGLVGTAYFAEQPLANPETIFLQLASAILNPWVAGILIAAILSAIMSTIDSQLLVCSSVIVEDFYKHLVNRNASEQELVWLSRMSLVVIAVIATVIATNPESSVLDLVSYAWAGFGAAFGPTVIMALFWSKFNKFGAIAAIISGAITVVVWKQLSGGIFDLYEIVPGFILAFLAGIVFSKLVDSENSEPAQIFERLHRED